MTPTQPKPVRTPGGPCGWTAKRGGPKREFFFWLPGYFRVLINKIIENTYVYATVRPIEQGPGAVSNLMQGHAQDPVSATLHLPY